MLPGTLNTKQKEKKQENQSRSNDTAYTKYPNKIFSDCVHSISTVYSVYLNIKLICFTYLCDRLQKKKKGLAALH